MCPPRRPSRRPTPQPQNQKRGILPPPPPPTPRIVEPRPTAESSPTADRMAGRVERTLPPTAPTPPPQALTPPASTEPAAKMRTINRTSVPTGTTVSGQQTTSTSAPSRRKKQSTRMGRRAGTRSLRISRNPNTGQGDLLY